MVPRAATLRGHRVKPDGPAASAWEAEDVRGRATQKMIRACLVRAGDTLVSPRLPGERGTVIAVRGRFISRPSNSRPGAATTW